MTAEQLIDEYIRYKAATDTVEVVGPAGPRKPKRRSLAQKQGARKGGRTRSRRQYKENKGFLYYEYYARDVIKNFIDNAQGT